MPATEAQLISKQGMCKRKCPSDAALPGGCEYSMFDRITPITCYKHPTTEYGWDGESPYVANTSQDCLIDGEQQANLPWPAPASVPCRLSYGRKSRLLCIIKSTQELVTHQCSTWMKTQHLIAILCAISNLLQEVQ